LPLGISLDGIAGTLFLGLDFGKESGSDAGGIAGR